MSIHQAMGQETRQGFYRDYLETLSLVERLHRLLLDVIKDEFERLGILEINAVQALLRSGTTVGEIYDAEDPARTGRRPDESILDS